MIESIRALFTDPAIPNLHAILVHFPVALLAVAPFFDFACLFFRRSMWMDRAASALYFIGTIGAGAAYLSGRIVAGAMLELSAVAEAAVEDHEDFALLTLVTFAGITLLRLFVSWLGRNDRLVRIGLWRLVALPAALAGLLLLALTADHGGALVYQHGLGVSVTTESASQ